MRFMSRFNGLMANELREANDLGLFGPDSVSWQLHAEPAMWLAGIRSL